MALTFADKCRLADLSWVKPNHIWQPINMPVYNPLPAPPLPPPDDPESGSPATSRVLAAYLNSDGHPMWFVSHASSNPFSLVMKTLQKRFEGDRPEDVFIWLGA